MKQPLDHVFRSAIKQRLMPALFCLLLLASMFVGFLSLSPATTPKAFAANNATKACQALVGKRMQPPVAADKVPTSLQQVKDCIKGYNAGYSNPSQNDPSGVCNSTVSHLQECKDGYAQGKKDASGGKPQPTAAEIKKDAETKCKPYKDQKNIDDKDRQDNFNGCVQGFTGQKNGKQNTDEACRGTTGPKLAACLNGWDIAINGKLASPGAGGAGSGTTTGTGTPTEDDSAASLGCDLGVDASPAGFLNSINILNYIFCGITKALVGVVDVMDNMVTSQLSVGSPGNSSEPSQIFTNENGKCTGYKNVCDSYKSAWAAFRTIALGLMVIAGLVVLIAQALGWELLDAYTIRKVLPRILIVAVGISLSWTLMRFLVELTNDLGYGIRHLIYAPFNNINGSLHLDLAQSFGTTILAGVGYLFAGAFGLMTLAGTGALALLVAFLVLVLRQIAIIVLIIVAPIAIVSYILPNTQKVYKFWWDSFAKALLMFPLIVAFIAAGRVFSKVALAGSDNLLNQMIGFAAYFAPYFLIPLTFRFAGGTLRNIGGFVNDRSRGGFDMLKNARKNNAQNRLKKARTGGIYRPEFGQFGKKGYSIGKALNRFGDLTLDADEYLAMQAGRTRVGKPFLGRKSDILQRQIAEQRMEHSQNAMKRLNLDYRTGRGLAGLHNYYLKEFDTKTEEGRKGRAALESRLNDAFGIENPDGSYSGKWRPVEGKEDAELLGGILAQYGAKGGKTAEIAAAELQAFAPTMGDLRGSDDTRRADLATVGLLTAARAGRLENEDIRDSQANVVGSKFDAGFATQRATTLQEVATQKRVEQARGHGMGYRYNKDTKQMEAYDVYEEPLSKAARDSFLRINGQELAGGKSEAIDSLEETMVGVASLYEMEDILDKDGNKTGKVKQKLVKDESGKWVPIMKKNTPEDKALDRARQAQERIKLIAGYASGDTDVGVKVQNIAHRLGMGDLSFGARMQQPGDVFSGPGETPPTGGGPGVAPLDDVH